MIKHQKYSYQNKRSDERSMNKPVDSVSFEKIS